MCVRMCGRVVQVSLSRHCLKILIFEKSSCNFLGLWWVTWFKSMAGTWDLKLPGIAFKLGIGANGQITIGGFKVFLMLSDKLQFPSFLGWFRFQFKGFWYYIRVTLKGLEAFRFSIGGSCRSVFRGIPFFCGSGHALKLGAGKKGT